MNGDWMSIVIGIISAVIGVILKKYTGITRRLIAIHELLHRFIELEVIQMDMLTKVRKYMENGKLTSEEMEELRALFQRKMAGIEGIKRKIHEVMGE